jgi:hypothetical protein
LLQGLMMLVSGYAAAADQNGMTDQYDDYTSRMLHAYQKEQASCGVTGKELECLNAEYEMERAASHLDALQEHGCAGGGDCETAPANFWGM